METLIGHEVTVERLFPDGTMDCICGEVIETNGTMLRIKSPKLEDLTPEHVRERNGGKKTGNGLIWHRPSVWINTACPIVMNVIEDE